MEGCCGKHDWVCRSFSKEWWKLDPVTTALRNRWLQQINLEQCSHGVPQGYEEISKEDTKCRRRNARRILRRQPRGDAVVSCAPKSPEQRSLLCL